MIIDTLKFAFSGLPFDYSTKTKAQKLIRQMKKLTVTRAALPRSNGIVASVEGNQAKLFRLGIPIIHPGKPVLYIHVIEHPDHTEVQGSFTFTIIARAALWLLLLFSFLFFALSIYQLTMGIIQISDYLFLTMLSFKILVGPLAAYLIITWYHLTWTRCQNDITDIAESLKKISR